MENKIYNKHVEIIKVFLVKKFQQFEISAHTKIKIGIRIPKMIVQDIRGFISCINIESNKIK